MRIWLVTALDHARRFIDQRRIEAPNQYVAETYAYEWIKSVGGDHGHSTVKEVTS